ncbi:MAG: phasin family protein [Eggerthellaceae bacterium]|nr:phasin family protein [Eggerthellaceae bacterium]
MSSIGDGFKNIFLAGLGAIAYTGEKGKEVIDQLVEKGEITLDQGRELNEELRRKADDATKDVREGALEAAMKAMTPEERDAFVAKAAEFARIQNEEAAQAAAATEAAAAEVEAEVEEVEAAVVEAVEDVAEAVEDAAAGVADEK